jgi:hypothetical protein
MLFYIFLQLRLVDIPPHTLRLCLFSLDASDAESNTVLNTKNRMINTGRRASISQGANNKDFMTEVLKVLGNLMKSF